jgi:uncharacterized damage-inducible protein DinB
MTTASISNRFLKALDDEATATRKCLEGVSENLFGWKPHEKSMAMGYLAVIVAEVPRWITDMAKEPSLDVVTYTHPDVKTAADLVAYFDKNMQEVRAALKDMPDEKFDEMFDLKANGKTLTTLSRKDNIDPIIRHWVHHRGQLTVYLRLNNIPVPSLYGPSADDRGDF